MSSKDSTADEGIKKIRSKSWVEPLGQCLEVTGTIFEIAGECGVPIVGLVGQVLGVGANLLREAFICQIVTLRSNKKKIYSRNCYYKRIEFVHDIKAYISVLVLVPKLCRYVLS